MNPSDTPTPFADAARPRIFIIFDGRRDGALCDQLREQAEKPSSAFVVIGSSEPGAGEQACEKARQAIGSADHVIVICGEHAESCPEMASELALAQELDIPYLLLWGERGVMCTKPLTAKPADAIYSWTRQILEHEIAAMVRRRLADRDRVPRRTQSARS